MRARTPERARVDRLYRQRRDEFVVANPVCQRCQQAPTDDLHHMCNVSQSGVAGLLDEGNWLAVCRPCHQFLTTHPNAAVEEGFSRRGWDYRRDGAL